MQIVQIQFRRHKTRLLIRLTMFACINFYPKYNLNEIVHQEPLKLEIDSSK